MTDLITGLDTARPLDERAWDPLARKARRGSILGGLLDPASSALVYLGVVVAIAGFVMLAIGWSEVAGEVDVFRQMPYLLSAGLPGIGLVMTGLVLINVSVRRQDGASRRQETAIVVEALTKLQQSRDGR